MDELDVFDARVKERAFRLWQEAGCPENTADEFWHRARAIELDELNLTPEELQKKRDAPSEAADFA